MPKHRGDFAICEAGVLGVRNGLMPRAIDCRQVRPIPHTVQCVFHRVLHRVEEFLREQIARGVLRKFVSEAMRNLVEMQKSCQVAVAYIVQKNFTILAVTATVRCLGVPYAYGYRRFSLV